MAGWPLKRSAVESPICCWNTASAGIHSSSTNFSTWEILLSEMRLGARMWQAYNVEILGCLLADKGSGNLRDLLRCFQLAIGADHQLLREVVLLLLLRHFGMQYRARVIADESGVSCNLIQSITRPRWTLNIAEIALAFCGGAEASSARHLMFARPPCLIKDSALPSLAAVILRLDDRHALSARRVACGILDTGWATRSFNAPCSLNLGCTSAPCFSSAIQ